MSCLQSKIHLTTEIVNGKNRRSISNTFDSFRNASNHLKRNMIPTGPFNKRPQIERYVDDVFAYIAGSDNLPRSNSHMFFTMDWKVGLLKIGFNKPPQCVLSDDFVKRTQKVTIIFTFQGIDVYSL